MQAGQRFRVDFLPRFFRASVSATATISPIPTIGPHIFAAPRDCGTGSLFVSPPPSSPLGGSGRSSGGVTSAGGGGGGGGACRGGGGGGGGAAPQVLAYFNQRLYASESPFAIAQHNAMYIALSAALVHLGNDPVMFNAELAHGAHGSVTTTGVTVAERVNNGSAPGPNSCVAASPSPYAWFHATPLLIVQPPYAQRPPRP